MSMTPQEIDALADAIAERLSAQLASALDSDAMIDVREVASILKCSVPTVERLTRTGAIPSVKLGRLRRYRRSDLIGRTSKGGAE